MDIDPEVWQEFQRGFNGDDLMFIQCTAIITLLLSIGFLAYKLHISGFRWNLRRLDHVIVRRGFFSDYRGYVHGKFLCWYKIRINDHKGGAYITIARWNLSHRRSKTSDKFRKAKIERMHP